MGKGKVVAISLGVLFVGMNALHAIGANAEAEFAAAELEPDTPVTLQSTTIVDRNDDSAQQPVSRVGATIYEQAVFDAFPEVAPKSRIAKRTASRAADFLAATINSADHMCVKPVVAEMAADGIYAIGCLTSRDGYGRPNYILNIRTGQVDQL